MYRTTIAILLATIGLAKADIIPITLDLGEPRTFKHNGLLRFDVPLNQPVGDGHWEVDITFANDNFIRLTRQSIERVGLGFDFGVEIDTTDGGSGTGWFPLPNGEGVAFPLLIHSGHFEFDLPQGGGALITDVNILFYSREFWAIGPHVPDSGSTIWLTLGALAGIAVLGRKQ